MNEKQQQLTFNKGITNVPSDAICSDNALEESIGLIYENGEHRVIQAPEEQSNYITSGHTLLYIHKIGTTKNIITTNGTYLYANGTMITNATANTTTTVTSIGKTLIVNTASAITYFLWKGSSYSKLTYPIPDLEFQARMRVSSQYGYFAYSSAKNEGIIDWDANDGGKWYIKSGMQGAYNDLVTGLYAKNKKSLANAKYFCEPFFVRAALELYDGTYTYITNPILLFPNVNKSSYGFLHGDKTTFVVGTNGARLEVCQKTDFSGYADIVKDVVVFVSKGAMIYNTDGDQPLTNSTATTSTVNVANCVGYVPSSLNYGPSLYYDIIVNTTDNPSPLFFDFDKALFCLKQRSDDDIKGDLEGTSVFYKVASLGINPINSFIDIGTKMADHVLPNLTTQEQLQYDDYFSRSEIKADGVYAYNGRLNLYGINRKLFSGFSYFMPLDGNEALPYTWYVMIVTDDGTKWVSFSANTYQKQGLYFFYPDPRAVLVVITKNGSVVCNKRLTTHPSLHGAYYLRKLPDGNNIEPSDSYSGSIPTPSTNQYENLPNYLLTSEVNNPWVVKAAGYNCVSTGKIIGVSTTTTALSEGQFGQYPLLVFSEEGIWSMSLDGTGMYTSFRPMSREVCNNPKSITQTDGAVFFSSEKGLMEIVGGQVKCVSEQLSGKNNAYLNLVESGSIVDIGSFNVFLKNAIIAYDYRDSMLWIFDTANTDNVGHPTEYNTFKTCWVYSIKYGTFGKFSFNHKVKNVVSDYPDYLLQADSYIYSLTRRKNINSDSTDYTCRMITRPMKLENALALKSIMQIRHIANFNTSATWSVTNNGTTTTGNVFGLRIFASNNITTASNNWVELSSLRGMPWKYYRFRYDFSHIKATDRFAGSVVITQERRTNKLR